MNPINGAASVSVSSEVLRKNPKGAGPYHGESARPEAGEQASPKPDELYGSPEIKNSGREDADHSRVKKAMGEVRKIEINNGTVTVRVYDSSGKLLRKIPPGYLPVGEQKFDITV